MAAKVHDPYIEQGTAWSHGIKTCLDYTGLKGRAYLSRCGQVIAAPAVTVPAAMGEEIIVSLSVAETLAIPICGRAFMALEPFDYLVELYDEHDPTVVHRLENGIARISPRAVQA